MTCDELRLQLPDYTLGTLSEMEMAAVRRHLRGCTACRSEAATLDEGVAMFASVAHVTDPPAELKDRVMSVLADEWAEAAPSRHRVRGLFVRWQALAAAFVLLAGLLFFGASAQSTANRFRADSDSYQSFLHALGGKDVRVATLRPRGNIDFVGSAILYDSDEKQSWVLILARSPVMEGDLTVAIQGPGGRTIKVPFPLKFDADGDAWSGMVTSADITQYTRVTLTDQAGHVVALGTAQER